MKIISSPSPNFDDRSGSVSVLMLHYTGMKSGAEAIARLCDEKARVSSHYVVEEDGAVYALVEEGRRAWHAGKSFWRGREGINDCSIGIEIVNPGHEFGYRAFPEVQMQAVLELCQGILSRHAIEPRNVIAHSDVAPDRKEDPGELFDWQYLATHGVGIYPGVELRGEPELLMQKGDSGGDVLMLKARLLAYGWKVDATHDAFDDELEKAVIAFARHFCPHRLDGGWDTHKERVLEALLATV